MCGLTGFARHPSGERRELATAVFKEMLLMNQTRGRHATGVAIVQENGERLVFKKAIEASKLVPSESFQRQMARITDHTTVVIGHTRNATQNNAHVDEAAHPFQMGRVIGAHNGVIYNWREVEAKLKEKVKNDGFYPTFCNDSQAAFAALDHWSDPVRATDELDGWFALTWHRGKRLFMCRTQNIELNAAYVGEMKTLFWSSERRVLDQVLKGYGVSGYDLWTLKPNTIYRYDPMAFTEKSANGDRRDAPFRGIGQGHRNVKVNGADPRRVLPGNRTPRSGFSTTSTSRYRSYPGTGRAWDVVAGQEVTDLTQMTLADEAMKRRKSLGGGNAEAEMDRVWDVISILNRQIRDMTTKCESLEAEIEHLYAVLNEKYEHVFDIEEDDGGTMEPGRGYREAPTCGIGRVANDGTKQCGECGKAGGVMLAVPGGGWIHETCVLGEPLLR